MTAALTRRRVDTAKALRAVRAVTRDDCRRYRDYWRRCAPTHPEDVWRRWVYAYASVNRNYTCHLQLFRWLSRLEPGFSHTLSLPAFTARLRRGGQGGMYGVSARGVWEFDRQFCDDPARFDARRATPARRDELAAGLHGLGRAKTAFALELLDPVGCKAVCIDRHIGKIFGFQPTDPFTDGQYAEAEDFWVQACKDRRLAPAIVRFVYWDRVIQKQKTCRYWSSVFEPWFDVKAWAAHHSLRW